MALVPVKTSAGTGYCDCICGCYELCVLRDEETGKVFCPRCAEQHMERNREIAQKMPQPGRAAAFASLPPGAKPRALQNRG
ncbi:MAG: hypothetical protein ACRD4D_05320 [Candidatus Acidiferrales bacterium]